MYEGISIQKARCTDQAMTAQNREGIWRNKREPGDGCP